MPTVLVVSPQFVPNNSPDMQRIRMSLHGFQAKGWQVIILSVKPKYLVSPQEPLLMKTIPSDVVIHHVSAMPINIARKFGLGDIAMRAYPFLWSKGNQIIKNKAIDLIYFSTTAFLVMTLGPIWKKRFNIPFVLDIQDPWVSDHPPIHHGLKHELMRKLHAFFEPRTVPNADGVIAVSADYITTLQQRYPVLRQRPSKVLTFAGSQVDFDILQTFPQDNPFFSASDGMINGVYIGTASQSMWYAIRIIFQALQYGLQHKPTQFSKIRLFFIGTSYAAAALAQKSVAPLATEMGVADYVKEFPARIPYFQVLQLLKDADFLCVPGFDDAQYTASKIFPYILAERPMLAVFHQNSSVVNIVQGTTSYGEVISFDPTQPVSDYVVPCYQAWNQVLDGNNIKSINQAAFSPFSANEMASQQCEFFEQVMK